MNLKTLDTENIELFERAFALYESAFPFEERRDRAEQARVMQNEAYKFDLVMDEEKFVGIMLYWEREDYIFLEHFAVLPSERNKGYGAKALDLLKEKGKRILLEIEPPTAGITNRRFNFYKRNGFIMNPYHHIQAKYHADDNDLHLKVLSYPNQLSDAQYYSFYEYMLKEISIKQDN